MEPPFQPGAGGVHLTRAALPKPHTLFRHFYDNGTIDFVALRDGGLQNRVVWGRRVRAGAQTWGDTPCDVPVAQWLPVFLEGVREFDEPYRFLAIRGAEALILEAGPALHDVAAECVPPLRKALECREPITVAIALELMLLALRVDTAVAAVWIQHLWQFAQVINLFTQQRYKVSLGYNSRELASVRQSAIDVLLLLEEHGGDQATALIRRFCPGVDPAVTPASQERRITQKRAQLGYKPWRPFTLF